MQSKLIFDFDGVLIDSMDEVALVAYNLLSDTEHLDLDALPHGYLQRFRDNRYHVQPAGDFIALASWACSPASESDSNLTRDHYDALLQSEQESLPSRTKRFFAMRNRLVAKDPIKWANINKPYQPLWQTLLARPDLPTIVTNKNIKAVADLCRHFGLQIDESRIYSGDHGATKSENLRTLFRSSRDTLPDMPPQNYIFIDDSIKNLIEIKMNLAETLAETQSSYTVDLRLAAWGYVSHDDLDLAHIHNISTITQSALCDTWL